MASGSWPVLSIRAKKKSNGLTKNNVKISLTSWLLGGDVVIPKRTRNARTKPFSSGKRSVSVTPAEPGSSVAPGVRAQDTSPAQNHIAQNHTEILNIETSRDEKLSAKETKRGTAKAKGDDHEEFLKCAKDDQPAPGPPASSSAAESTVASIAPCGSNTEATSSAGLESSAAEAASTDAAAVTTDNSSGNGDPESSVANMSSTGETSPHSATGGGNDASAVTQDTATTTDCEKGGALTILS